jgi:hypothetical protein
VTDPVFELFDEFAVRHARGEHPDPVEYLDRAGDHETDLAEVLDVFLAWAPAPTPDDSAVTMMNAWLAGDAPLVALRVSRSLRVDDLVEEVTSQLGLEPAKRSKVRRYVQRLEQGLLDAGRVDRRVYDALSLRLATTWSTIASWASPPRRMFGDAVAAAVFRAEVEPAVPPPVPGQLSDEWDEVDELFLGPRAA